MATSSVDKDLVNRVKHNHSKSSLRLSDVKCPICLGILIKPVTTPCNHELCLDCFNKNIELVQIACPVCRRRISVWVRQAVRENRLVNNARWEQIKRCFPERIRHRLDGDTDSQTEDDTDAPAIHSTFAEPGEIRKEYEELLKQFQEECEREKTQEVLASETLIRELQRQDRQQMVEGPISKHHVTSQDEVLVKDVCRNYIKSSKTGNRTAYSQKASEVFRNQNTGIMKGSLTCELLASLDKENTELRSASAESHDSISSEMCHFKPISAAPRTPPKRLPDGRFEEPEVVYTRPRRLDYQSSKVLSIKVEAMIVKSRNKTDCGSIPFHSNGTPFINKKFSCARKPNIDLSFKENYPYFSGNGSQSLSPSKSVLTGANQNGGASTRIVKNTRATKSNHKSECNLEDNASPRKRKSDGKGGQCKLTKLESEENDASTSQVQSTNRDECDESSWVELQRQALERMKQEERDRQLAMELQEEFNKALQSGQQANGYQYFLRSQKKK